MIFKNHYENFLSKAGTSFVVERFIAVGQPGARFHPRDKSLDYERDCRF
jgi:hypothetical protein